MIKITKSSQETRVFAKDLALEVRGGDVILLRGDLGSGKTTFTQGFAEGLGIKKQITSPTFLIIKTYEVLREDIKTLYHLDLYRLSSEKEIEEIGILDIFDDLEGVAIIEWGERLGNLLPMKRIDLRFKYLGEDKREISLEKINYD